MNGGIYLLDVDEVVMDVDLVVDFVDVEDVSV